MNENEHNDDVIEEAKLEDAAGGRMYSGRENGIFVNEDGNLVLISPDGSRRTKYPDGKIVTTYPDGSSQTVYPDGTTVFVSKKY